MSKPEGTLTPVQHEIMEVVWDRGSRGATVSEIWQAVSAVRSVIRTTVLNLVDRLEKRGWLIRQRREGAYHYTAVIDRQATSALLACDFVDDFFGGSASDLVMSLFGSERLKPEDVHRLRQLLRTAPTNDDNPEAVER